MSPFARTWMTAGLALTAAFGWIQGSRADTTSADPALLARYFADVNAHDVDALKDVMTKQVIPQMLK